MASQAYWGSTMTLSTFEQTDGTGLNVATLQNVEIIPSFDVFEYLYGADSVKFETEKQGEFSVTVNVGASKWDVATLQHWLGGSGSSSTGLVDTSDPALFNITGEISPADGSGTNLSVAVTRCSTDEMPMFSADRSEYVQWDVTFTGQDINPITGP
jgi:hypothetical protein